MVHRSGGGGIAAKAEDSWQPGGAPAGQCTGPGVTRAVAPLKGWRRVSSLLPAYDDGAAEHASHVRRAQSRW